MTDFFSIFYDNRLFCFFARSADLYFRIFTLIVALFEKFSQFGFVEKLLWTLITSHVTQDFNKQRRLTD